MAKNIVDQARLDYLQRFKDFSAVVNPKPSAEEIAERNQRSLDERGLNEKNQSLV